MNKQKIRELFGEMKSDLRDFYDARRDMIEAERHVLNRALDIAAELVTDSNVISETNSGVTVMVPPPNAHTWYLGRCISHPNCTEPVPIDIKEIAQDIRDMGGIDDIVAAGKLK